MCDYSLHHVKSRAAKVDDKLIVHDFGTGTRGFAEVDIGEDGPVAICVLPGTEIAFENKIPVGSSLLGFYTVKESDFDVAIFRQVNKDQERAHHDALELPDGNLVMLTALPHGLKARILSLPAAPKTPEEAQNQERVAFVG